MTTHDDRIERVMRALYECMRRHGTTLYESNHMPTPEELARAAVAAMDAEPCTRRDCVSQVESLEEQVRTLIQSNIAKERHIKTLLEGQPTAAMDAEPRRLTATERTLLVFATRYAMGRMTMAPSMVDAYIREHIGSLTPNDMTQIADEIDEHDEWYSLGMDCDRLRWHRLRDWLREMSSKEATDAEPPLEDMLLSSGLVSDGLPGYDVAIAHDDGEWYASQQQVTMNESWPTGIVGTGPTINAAIHDAVEIHAARANAREAT